MIRVFVRKFLFLIQRVILAVSWNVFRIIKINKTEGWIVGVEETASMLHNISKSVNIPSVRLYTAPYYNFKYDFDWSKNTLKDKVTRIFFGPILLAYLIRKKEGFIYIGSEGFLISGIDARKFEFNYIKEKQRKIICMFMGSEIRSYKLLGNYSLTNSIDVIPTYQKFVNLGIDSTERELFREQLGKVADQYADAISNARVDQMAYIKRETSPFLYFYPEENFNLHIEKWHSVKRLKVFHAPSSPIIKGTQLVRAAVKKLQEEGYNFDYIEMSGVPHVKILNELSTAHIVLNQFYSFIPGVFGIESMATGCVLLTSATSAIEETLPKGADAAWVVTPYWLVYDNLKSTLDTPIEQLSQQAKNGFSWAHKNCSYSASSHELNKIISEC